MCGLVFFMLEHKLMKRASTIIEYNLSTSLKVCYYYYHDDDVDYHYYLAVNQSGK